MKNINIKAQEEENINRKQKILDIAGLLFLTQGYEKTSMRQIAAEAGVSLGLVTYYFNVKKEIAFALLKHQLGVFAHYAKKYLQMDEDPVLFSAVLVKLTCRVLASPKFYNFFMDMLKSDIYQEVVIDSGIEIFEAINNKYQLELDEDYMKLYGNYIPVGVERTLMLYAKDYQLTESVADLAFKAYMVYFINDMGMLNRFCKKSEIIVALILDENPGLCDLGFLLEDIKV